MIEATGVTKFFDDIAAVSQIDAVIRNGSVFGLIGSNGAGKSTFLRIAAGILKPDGGTLRIDGEDVYENLSVKSRCYYISDEQYFFPNSTPDELRRYYQRLYPRFDNARYRKLMDGFGLNGARKIRTFSKGMKKQVSVICGLCAGADYLFCDETFDGLDPVVRQAVKGLFAADVAERNLTPIIASHNLRELEDICDHVGLLHRGGILLSRDLDDMKLGIHKLQCIFPPDVTPESLSSLAVLHTERRGSLWTMTVRGEPEQVRAQIEALRPTFFEMLPLSLEEIFISETEVAGYDIKKLLL